MSPPGKKKTGPFSGRATTNWGLFWGDPLRNTVTGKNGGRFGGKFLPRGGFHFVFSPLNFPTGGAPKKFRESPGGGPSEGGLKISNRGGFFGFFWAFLRGGTKTLGRKKKKKKHQGARPPGGGGFVWGGKGMFTGFLGVLKGGTRGQLGGPGELASRGLLHFPGPPNCEGA